MWRNPDHFCCPQETNSFSTTFGEPVWKTIFFGYPQPFSLGKSAYSVVSRRMPTAFPQDIHMLVLEIHRLWKTCVEKCGEVLAGCGNTPFPLWETCLTVVFGLLVFFCDNVCVMGFVGCQTFRF